MKQIFLPFHIAVATAASGLTLCPGRKGKDEKYRI